MRPPEIRENSADLLELICDLIEAPRARIGANFLNARISDVERLVTFGLVRRGSAPRTIACRACDEDHATTPEFDSVAGRYFHFCPLVERGEIEPHDMETMEICARTIVDLLVAAFPVLPAIGQELVAGKAWHLGEAVVGGTSAHADLRVSNWKSTDFRCAGKSGRCGAGHRNRNDRNEPSAARSPTGAAKSLHDRRSPRHRNRQCGRPCDQARSCRSPYQDVARETGPVSRKRWQAVGRKSCCRRL